jgi:hypothetical protein
VKSVVSAVFLVTLFATCSKSDPGTIITHQYSATIRVTVSELMNSNGTYTDSLISGAKVDVFESKEDRDLALPANYSKTTGSNGMAEFTNLEKSYYYIRVTNPKTQAVIKDETSTPDGTISLVQIIFQ